MFLSKTSLAISSIPAPLEAQIFTLNSFITKSASKSNL